MKIEANKVTGSSRKEKKSTKNQVTQANKIKGYFKTKVTKNLKSDNDVRRTKIIEDVTTKSDRIDQVELFVMDILLEILKSLDLNKSDKKQGSKKISSTENPPVQLIILEHFKPVNAGDMPTKDDKRYRTVNTKGEKLIGRNSDPPKNNLQVEQGVKTNQRGKLNENPATKKTFPDRNFSLV